MSKKLDSRIKLIEKLRIQLKGYVYVGDKSQENWKRPLPFYAFKCPIHGLVSDYPHGYDQRLECPMCREESMIIRNKNDKILKKV